MEYHRHSYSTNYYYHQKKKHGLKKQSSQKIKLLVWILTGKNYTCNGKRYKSEITWNLNNFYGKRVTAQHSDGFLKFAKLFKLHKR